MKHLLTAATAVFLLSFSGVHAEPEWEEGMVCDNPEQTEMYTRALITANATEGDAFVSVLEELNSGIVSPPCLWKDVSIEILEDKQSIETDKVSFVVQKIKIFQEKIEMFPGVSTFITFNPPLIKYRVKAAEGTHT